jgi:tetratricopeptide (TPR) repeat protein
VKKLQILLFVFYLMSFGVSLNLYAQIPDSLKKIYSLFSEYHKNKDYQSALPYGWDVIKYAPEHFSKWVFYKMEDCLWYLHDSSNISQEELKSINDTIMYFYEQAIKYRSEDKGYFQVRKAFVAETWLKLPADEVIKLYELAFEWKPDLSIYYYHRLGQLYKSNMNDENDYKLKALDLYSALSEKEPDNIQWVQELESLVDNIDELLVITKKNWEANKDDLSRAWKYASTAIRARDFNESIIPLEFLVAKVPDGINYWNQLATAYQKTDRLNDAERAFKKLIELEPDKKEYNLNLGLVYKEMNKYSAARSEFQKANDKGGGWGLAVYYEGLLYEASARACEFNFETKLVYLLAQNTYRRAFNMDPSLTEAQERISALNSSVPSKEDYFFRGIKSGQTLQITGSCFGWIARSITVP